MKRITLLLLVFTFGFAQAQTLEKKKITLRKNSAKDKLADFTYSFNSAQDEQNYYLFCKAHLVVYNRDYEKTLFIVNKNLTTVKAVELKFNKGENFHSVFFTNEHLCVVCDVYDKKGKEMNIIVKRYSKKTGVFVNNTTIAKFKAQSWKHYASYSPDRTKYGVIFLAGNKNGEYEQFHAFVLDLDEGGQMLWKATKRLQVSNKKFRTHRISTSNNGKIYITFSSSPENKRSSDQTTYIDLNQVGENENEHVAIPLDKSNENIADLRTKTLKNGDLLFACLFAKEKESHPTHLQTIMFDAENFKITNNSVSEIPKMETKSPVVMPYFGMIPTKHLYSMDISSIEELDNGEIAIVCEQARSTRYSGRNYDVMFYVRGDIMTAFLNKEGVVEHYDVFDRFQKANKGRYLNTGVFTMGNQVCYLFNDHPNRFQAGKKDATFDGQNTNNAVIACNKISNGNPVETVFITDKSGKANKCFQNVLLKDGDKLLIVTGNSSTMDLEIIKLD